MTTANTDGESLSKSPLTIIYSSFEVYRDTIDKYNLEEQGEFDSLTTALIEECRK